MKASCWFVYNGKEYYLGEDGAMVVGKQVISGKEYVFNTDGQLEK